MTKYVTSSYKVHSPPYGIYLKHSMSRSLLVDIKLLTLSLTSSRMNPYSCMSTDNREGIIQVVLNAETIANIQRQKGMFSATCAFRKGSLLGMYLLLYH